MPESTLHHQPRSYRQVVVRLPAEDVEVLDLLAREHGSITSAILAALRSLDQLSSAQPAPATPVQSVAVPAAASRQVRRQRPTGGVPVSPRLAERWVSLVEAAGRMQIRPDALRRRATAQGAVRGRGAAAEVNIDRLVVDRYLAARVGGVTSQTLRHRLQQGKLQGVGGDQHVRRGDVYPEPAKCRSALH